MRLHLSAIAALALFAAPGDAATRNFTVTGFDRIRVDGPYRVKLTTGVAPFATADGSPAALDAVSLEVQGRTLIIRRKAAVQSNSTQRSGPVSIVVGTHELAAAWLNGSGGLAVNAVKGRTFELAVSGSGAAEVGKINVDRLRVAISGSASVVLGGTAEIATFSVRGPSALDASALSAEAATIAAEGSSTLKLTATGTAKVDARGLATIDLAGKPACTIRPNSTAEVSGCR
ncbi:MAG: DUF2807 domain-containing protein [Pseudomonadota bacterium]|nr:DUF2807 domain-containing protein [Sphingomonas sp.]MDQ3477639.1 DUF2807 domain-containing protein [Pseudomonadota bacterium]